jgi:hypothetical protein
VILLSFAFYSFFKQSLKGLFACFCKRSGLSLATIDFQTLLKICEYEKQTLYSFASVCENLQEKLQKFHQSGSLCKIGFSGYDKRVGSSLYVLL